MYDGNLKPGEKAFLTVLVLAFALLATYCTGSVDHGALPMETYDRDIIGGREP